jgi:hypothetical protein
MPILLLLFVAGVSYAAVLAWIVLHLEGASAQQPEARTERPFRPTDAAHRPAFNGFRAVLSHYGYH